MKKLLIILLALPLLAFSWECPVDFHDTGTACVEDTPIAPTPPTTSNRGSSGDTTWCTETRTTFCRPQGGFPTLTDTKDEQIEIIKQIIVLKIKMLNILKSLQVPSSGGKG